MNYIEELEAAVSEERLVSGLKQLISLPSENPLGEAPEDWQGEESVALYLAERLEPLGFSCELRKLGTGRYSIVAERAGASERSLMLAGHLDTVSSEGCEQAYPGLARGGRVYGRGACDMKAALACYVEVAEVLASGGWNPGGKLYIVGVADEEYRMEGAREVGRNGPHASGVIVGEPTGLEVCPAARGRVSTRIITRGRAAHSSIPEWGVNAITHMGPVLRALEDYERSLLRREPHPLVGTPRITPGVISGGVQVNIVPDECRLEVDRRTLPDESTESVYAELEDLLEEVAARTPGLRAELSDPTWLVSALQTPPDHPLVEDLVGAVRAVTGRDRVPVGFPAGTDAGYFGSPAVVCGPGSLEQAHTAEEFVEVSELVEATRVYLRAIGAFLGKDD